MEINRKSSEKNELAYKLRLPDICIDPLSVVLLSSNKSFHHAWKKKEAHGQAEDDAVDLTINC